MEGSKILNIKLIIKPFRVFRVVRGSLSTFLKDTIQPLKIRMFVIFFLCFVFNC